MPKKTRKPAEPAKKATRKAQFDIRALDPIRKCGPGTSVQALYRVEELPGDGPARTHLVFFDRHGWYCEHGRDCPAVRHAQHHHR